MAYLMPIFSMACNILNNQYYIMNMSMAILCCIYSILTFNIQNNNFSEKSAFEPGLLFLRKRDIVFKIDVFPCIFRQARIPECAYRP